MKLPDGHHWSPPTTCVDPPSLSRTTFSQESVIWAQDDTDDDNGDPALIIVHPHLRFLSIIMSAFFLDFTTVCFKIAKSKSKTQGATFEGKDVKRESYQKGYMHRKVGYYDGSLDEIAL